MKLSPRSATRGPQRQHRIAILGATKAGLAMAAKLGAAGYRNIVVFDPGPAPAEGPQLAFVRYESPVRSLAYSPSGTAWSVDNGDTFQADIVICATTKLSNAEWELSGVDAAKQYMQNERATTPLFELGNRYPVPLPVTGRNGVTLDQALADGAVSHLGLTVPGFPNFFLLVGPNTRLAYNPMKLMVDAQVGAIVSLLHTIDARQADEVEVSRAVASASYAATQKQFIDGRNDLVWPGSTLSYVWQCKRLSPKQYCFGQRPPTTPSTERQFS